MNILTPELLAALPETIPCLSLWQPWATLVEIEAKINETRSWATSYRGPLAIHAAKMWTVGEQGSICFQEPFQSTLRKHLGGIAKPRFPFGAILCIVDLWGCEEIDATNAPHGDELAFGDYTPGRFMWITRPSRLLRLPKPVPYKARQRLFRIPTNILLGN